MPLRKTRSDAGTGRWSTGNCVEWKRAWRDKNRLRVREYMKRYMQKYRNG